MITASNTISDGPIQVQTTTAPNLVRLSSMLKSALLQTWHAYKVHRSRQLAKAHLIALDERLLKDIGIDRSEIHSMLMDRARERRRGICPQLEMHF